MNMYEDNVIEEDNEVILHHNVGVNFKDSMDQKEKIHNFEVIVISIILKSTQIVYDQNIRVGIKNKVDLYTFH